jgi:hypothetical protein
MGVDCQSSPGACHHTTARAAALAFTNVAVTTGGTSGLSLATVSPSMRNADGLTLVGCPGAANVGAGAEAAFVVAVDACASAAKHQHRPITMGINDLISMAVMCS